MNNPYAAPLADLEAIHEGMAVREGKLVGVLQDARLPLVCATCGTTEGVQHSAQRLDLVLPRGRFFMVLPAAIAVGFGFSQLLPSLPSYAALTVGLVAYHLLARLAAQRSPLAVPQCALCDGRWRFGSWLQSIGNYFGYAGYIAVWQGSRVLGLGLVGINVVLVMILGRPRIVVRIEKVERDRVWLDGVHESAAVVYCSDRARA